ncbi:MAG TPA: aminopeptidase family protein P, partial [Magnetovibrio sp.]
LRAEMAAQPAGRKIGFDPWLHTPQGLEAILSVCRENRAELISLDDNPIDAEWPDRPAPPASAIQPWAHPYAALSSTAKLGQIATSLKNQGVDAAVLCTGDSVSWAFNIRGNDVPFTPLVLAFAIVTADAKAQLFIEPSRLNDPVRSHLGEAISVLPPHGLGPALDALGRAQAAVLLAPDVTATWITQRLSDSGARTVLGEDPCLLPKACKQPTEIAGIKRAHIRDGVALVRFLAWLEDAAPKGGVTELSAARHLDGLRSENELFRGLSFPTISGSGPNGAIVHYRVTEQSDRELRPGDLYLVDSGGQYLDGTTDVTRTVAIGKPSSEMRDRFTRVLKGHIAISAQRFPRGTQGQELDLLARRALWDAGLDYDHGTGHGVGTYLGVHEGPQRIAKRGPGVELMVGMVLSNEPGYYKAKAFGIRIENLITVVPAPIPKGGEREMLGFEPLTLAPIDLQLIEIDLLDENERAWLNAYHALVRETLAPLLDPPTRTWLDHATRSLSASN